MYGFLVNRFENVQGCPQVNKFKQVQEVGPEPGGGPQVNNFEEVHGHIGPSLEQTDIHTTTTESITFSQLRQNKQSKFN